MFSRIQKLIRSRPGWGLLLIFSVTILLPGIALALFGLRAWRQERHLVEQQIQERLATAAKLAVQDLEQELRSWEQALEQASQARSLDAVSLPRTIRRALEEEYSGVIIVLNQGELRAFPPRNLLYDPVASSALSIAEYPVTPALVEAESYESRTKDYAKALALYKRLVVSAKPSERPLLLHRLARTYRKTGRPAEALRIYAELSSISGLQIGTIPVDLVARHEQCSLWAETGASKKLANGALELYRDLVRGSWYLEKPRYLFYSHQAQEWLESSPELHPEVSTWRALEEQKHSLTLSVERLLELVDSLRHRRQENTPGAVRLTQRFVDSEPGKFQLFWRSYRVGDQARVAGVVLAKSYLQAQVWPRVFASAAGEHFHVCLLGSGGQVLFGATAPQKPSLAVTESLEKIRVSWQIQVWPREPAAFYSEFAWRQNLYLGMLVLVVALLIFGSYLTLRTVKKELEIARLKSDFVSTVSHEFRSPLTSIRQLGEMLMRGRVPNEQRRQQYYELITRESERLARLVENVLDFSRMEEGRKQYRFEPLAATPWLRQLVDDFQSEVAGSGFSVETKVPENLPVLRADKEALTSAVQNLLDNAIKYSTHCRTVWLEAEPKDSELVIRVRDRGIGIDPEDQTHIFEKFYRSGREEARQVRGTGLGLSLVKHIVDAHHGKVDFESRKGEGSTFSIQLPV